VAISYLSVATVLFICARSLALAPAPASVAETHAAVVPAMAE
jgi:hypothetical protein